MGSPPILTRRGCAAGNTEQNESGSAKMMLKIVLLQLIICLVATLFTWVGFSGGSAKFVLIGCLCGWAPGALFALNLSLLHNLQPTSKVVVWFLGEMSKILLSVILLYLVYRIFKGETLWLPLIIGLIVSLQANVFALMVTK